MMHSFRLFCSIALVGISIVAAGCAIDSTYTREYHLNDELGTDFTKPNTVYHGSIERSEDYDLPNPVW